MMSVDVIETESVGESRIFPGQIVRKIRLNQNLTQEELAKKARLPVIAIMRIERNGLGCCARHYMMVAKALNVPGCRFFMTEDMWERISGIIE